MSNSSTLDPLVQEVISQLPIVVSQRYSILSALVILTYDYFLTFPLELRQIWHGRMNIMRILFILNRYSSLLSFYGEFLSFFIKPATTPECRAGFFIYEIADLLAVFATFCIFTLRTYAIYSKSRIVFFLLAMPGFVGFSSGIWLTVAQSSVALPPELQIGPWTCNYFLSSSGFVAELVNFIGDAFFDVLVVIFTVYRTGSLALQSKKANISRSLSFILLRDGTLYYSAIFAPQFVLVALFAINLNTGSSNLANISASLDYICTSLQAVLVNRLVLNLCHAANEREDSEFRTRTGLEPPTFATGPILDSIGGPVRTIPDDLDDDFLQGEGAEDMEMTNMSSANRKSYRNLEIEEIRL